MSEDNEREEQLMQRYQLDHHDSLQSQTVTVHGLRFNYFDGSLEGVEWDDPCEFVAHHHERLVEDAIAEDSREAQQLLSYAWLLIRQKEMREYDAKMKAEHGQVILRKIETLYVDSDMDTYLEDLCDPRGR